jgi:hypothetical protein
VARHREILTTCNARKFIGPSQNTLGLLMRVGSPPPTSMFKIGKCFNFDENFEFFKKFRF